MMKDTIGQVDRVVHLAAAVGVRKIIESPVETITTNVRGTDIVLDCCDKHEKPLYVASTSEIYGKGGDRLHEEHDRVMGSTTHRRWSYACTKALDEFLALAYNQEYGLPVVLGRFFNTVGPRQSGEWGMVMPTFVKQALAGDPITVFGEGDQRRSFCHVDDSVRAVLGLLDAPGAVGEAFNIGNENEITIMELAERVKDRVASASEIVVVPYDEAYGEGFEDMERRQPDIGKIHGLLGWEQHPTEYITVPADPPTLGDRAFPGDEESITRSDRGVGDPGRLPQDGRDDFPIPEHPHLVPLAPHRGPTRHRQDFRKGRDRIHSKEPSVTNGPADPQLDQIS